MLRLISICLIAISKDFFDNVLPKPELSGDEEFADKLLQGEYLLSCFAGGASFRIFTTLSTILVPIRPGLTLSLALACNRLIAGIGTELPLLRTTPLGGRPLAGEQDCRLILPFVTGSMDEDLTFGAPGLPLVAEIGLSDSDVRKLGGASRENPGISEGFHGLGFTVGELARATPGFLVVVVAVETEDGDLTGGAVALAVLDAEVGRRVGVAALDVDLDPGTEALVVGVEEALVVGIEDLALDLAVGVEDLGGTVDLAEGKVTREVGVEDLDGRDAVAVDIVLEVAVDVIDFDAAVDVRLDADVKADIALNVGRPVGVEGLDPPDEDGLRRPELEAFNP